LRAAKARRLLERTTLNLHEIALESQFQSAARLIRAFKQVFGLTPNSFRARLLAADARVKSHTKASDMLAWHSQQNDAMFERRVRGSP